ncbi:MAG: TIGR04282 family arsenosugar biosynthesis glycosyltransferase [Cyclobacteriaceae bacterium]|nr:TIGR04282 family arsenosugar biosynthesis glycosyltransferase [Cyclobacteriaceae bacterium]
MKNLLIIFYRNPELGKVKTRLAKTLGDEKALAIYLTLSSHTRFITENLDIDRVIYYSNFVDTEDAWPNKTFYKELQNGNDLGEKMKNAFADGFTKGYERVCIIGTDCFELSESAIKQAFDQLRTNDAVIGSAKDGGYYLLGMKKQMPELFKNKAWSTDTVSTDTIQNFKDLGVSFAQLQVLTDVDEEKDLPAQLLTPIKKYWSS